MANYVDKDSFRLELISSNVNDELTPKAVDMFILMVDRIQSSFKYDDYQDKEDCRAAALEVCMKNWKKFDVSRPNPFAFFTRTIYNGLYAGWNELVKHRADHSYSEIFTEST